MTLPGQQRPAVAEFNDKKAFFDNVESSFQHGLNIETLYIQSCELAQSLKANLSDTESLSMLPSFIDRAPSGKEEGSVITLDIGGSTMRVALIKLNPTANSVADRLKVERKQQWLIEQCVKELYADRFFDWIAQNVKTFFENQGMTIDGELSSIPLGLVWSFPLESVPVSTL